MMLRSPQSLAFSAALIVAIYLTWTTLRSYSYANVVKEEWRLQREASEQLTADLTRQNHDLQIALNAQKALAEAPSSNENPPLVVPVVNTARPGHEMSIPDGSSNATPDVVHDRFAYLFYATADPYACSVLVNIHRLQNLFHTVLPVHVLVSSEVDQRFIDAMRAANATVHVKDPPPVLPHEGDSYYKDCLLKLLAFEMHILAPGLTRVLMFDSDQLVMKNLDHLFDGLPDVDLAAPRAYWLAKDFISSTFLMINLSDRLWKVVKNALDTRTGGYDMDIINTLLGDTVLMLGGEYVTINSHWEDWNLPSWFHAINEINVTDVKAVNEAIHLPPGYDDDDDPDDQDYQDTVDDAVDYTEKATFDKIVRRQQQPALGSDPIPTKEPALNPSTTTTSVAEVQSTTTSTAPTSESSAITVWKRPKAPPPTPRFPAAHPLSIELYRLRDAAAVIHFFAVGKPWNWDIENIHWDRPDAHPLLAELFDVWRSTAEEVCPGGLPAL